MRQSPTPTIRPAEELAKRRSREVIEEGWIGKNREWFVKPEQHSFPIRHLFPQERFLVS
jgi:hypothetical protein